MRVLFMGTPDFAVPTLEALVKDSHFEVVGVFTQPDRPKGRGNQLAAPPVKEFALQNNIPVFQPDKIRNQETYDLISNLKPEAIVVVAYGKILPKEILEIPNYGCINVHSSVLPELRGAAPIHWAIYQGKTKTGVSTMLLDEGMDTGEILLNSEREIPLHMTMGELHDQLKNDGADLLLKTLIGLESGIIKSTPQDHSKATHASLITKDHELLDWNRSAEELHNQIRAFNPWPGCYTYFQGQRIKIWKSDFELIEANGKPGEIRFESDKLQVGTGKGMLTLLEVQPQSKAKMSSIQWGRGQKFNKTSSFEAQ